MSDETEIEMMALDRRIRVLQVIGALDPGGAENVVASLARHADASRFEVAICCTRVLGQFAAGLNADGISVVLAAPPSRRYRHFTPLWLQRVVRQFRPDVVHSHTLLGLTAAGPLAHLRLLPHWIHTFHYGNYPYARQQDMRTERLLSLAATQLVAVSNAQREAIVSHHRVSQGRIITVPNGVAENPVIDVPGVRERSRATFGFSPNDVVIGCVAVLSEQKGITYLLRAIPELLRGRPNLKVLIVGGGPLEASLRAEAAALELGSVVTFTGWRRDIPEILSALDVFVMPSLWEAMPLALLEAMAARRPIVVTDVGDNAAIVGNGTCALVVPPRDVVALAGAVSSLLSQPERARALGELAYRRFIDRFGVARMVQRYEQIYGALVAGTAHPVASTDEIVRGQSTV
jgi:glycosyltransferase involved in cell wall biosynthesis